jgi:hypothetical protein
VHGFFEWTASLTQCTTARQKAANRS